MRIYTLPAVIAAAIVVTGCGPESTGGNPPRNPAVSVSENVDSFTVRDQDGLAPVVPNTVFFDFYRGLEPVNAGEDKNTAAALRGRLDELMGLTPSEDGKSYVAARNPLDFLNHVIADNRIPTFSDGRQLMRQAANESIAARYNNQSNGATIRFTEVIQGESGGPAQETLWVFPLLDWTSNPQANNDPQDDTVSSARQFVARPPEDDSETPAEIQSIFWSAQFSAPEFSVSGHNQPACELLNVTPRAFGNMEFSKAFANSQERCQNFNVNKIDILTLSGARPEDISQSACGGLNLPPAQPLNFAIAGENPDCVRVEVDYANSEVRVFTSQGEANLTDDCLERNPNYCGNQSSEQNQEAVSYPGITINSRQ